MRALGFNIKKGELHYCLLQGTRAAPQYVAHGKQNFEASQKKPHLANHFKQAFNELILHHNPSSLAYRLSLEAKKADQYSYLCFSYGILNLIAFEREIPIFEYTTQSFSKKALHTASDKWAACDEKIADAPNNWKNETKLSALSAWMNLE